MMYLRYDTVSDAVSKRDEGQRDKGRYCVADVCPVDFGNLTGHKASNLRFRVVNESLES